MYNNCVIAYFQIVKKLTGLAGHIAKRATSIGNEIGQVLNCVLTVSEGHVLAPLISGIIDRYKTAGVDPTTLLCVDCGWLSGPTRNIKVRSGVACKISKTPPPYRDKMPTTGELVKAN